MRAISGSRLAAFACRGGLTRRAYTDRSERREGRRRVRGGGTIHDLWERYRTGDAAAREGLILHYSPLVKFVAGRIAAGLPSHADRDDLISDGLVGLIDAVERFEPERGVPFEAYATQRIRGAILDGLRSLDWMPQRTRRLSKQVDATISGLSQALGRVPTDEEVAVELDLETEAVRRVMVDTTALGYASMDAPVLGDERDASFSELVRDPAAIDPEQRALLREALELLPDREQTVIVLYYREGMTLAEIGKVLGISESRVWHLHARAVRILRARLTAKE